MDEKELRASKEGRVKTYKYADLSIDFSSSEHGISLQCTDPQIIAWILTDLKKVGFGYRLKGKREFPSGEMYSCTIDKLRGRALDVYFWIITQLCKRGWEPFGDRSRFRFEGEG